MENGTNVIRDTSFVISMLEKKRSAALEEIHFKERQLQRLDYLVILHFMHSRNDRAELNTSGGLHDHVVASLYLKLQRIEEIYLARCTKSYTDYFCHIYLPH